MRVSFKTNIDAYQWEQWPIVDEVLPNGTLVESKNGRVLQVVSSTVKASQFEWEDVVVETELHFRGNEDIEFMNFVLVNHRFPKDGELNINHRRGE